MTRSSQAGVFGIALALAACAAVAQTVAPAAAPDAAPATPAADAWSPRTGDAWVDRQLGDINLYAGRYRGAFLDELVRYHAAPRELITALLVERHWAPGDVYYACAVAQLAGRPCRSVVDAWEQGRADGWQAVAGRSGLDADAKRRIRKTIGDSFARWGRPLAKPAPDARATAAPARSAKHKAPPPRR